MFSQASLRPRGEEICLAPPLKGYTPRNGTLPCNVHLSFFSVLKEHDIFEFFLKWISAHFVFTVSYFLN